jgi:hypothetical protein
MLQPAAHTGLPLGTHTNIGFPEQTLPVAHVEPKNEPFGKHAFSLLRQDRFAGHLVEPYALLHAGKQSPPDASEHVSAALTLAQSVSPAEPLGHSTTQLPL